MQPEKVTKPKREKTPEEALSTLMRLCARAERSQGDARRLLRGWGIREAEAERSVEHARKALNLLAGYPDEPHGGVAGRNASSAIAAETMALIAGSERVLGRIQISGTVSVFNPEDVPLRYRKEVGEYFKRLSEKQQRKEREEKP